MDSINFNDDNSININDDNNNNVNNDTNSNINVNYSSDIDINGINEEIKTTNATASWTPDFKNLFNV